MGVHTRVTLGSRVYCNHNGCMCASYMLCITLCIMTRQTILAVVLYSHQFFESLYTSGSVCAVVYSVSGSSSYIQQCNNNGIIRRCVCIVNSAMVLAAPEEFCT